MVWDPVIENGMKIICAVIFFGGGGMTKIKPGLKQTSFKGLSHFVCSHVNGKWDAAPLYIYLKLYVIWQNT